MDAGTTDDANFEEYFKLLEENKKTPKVADFQEREVVPGLGLLNPEIPPITAPIATLLPF